MRKTQIGWRLVKMELETGVVLLNPASFPYLAAFLSFYHIQLLINDFYSN